LSVGGIVKHLTRTEVGWVDIITGAYDPQRYEGDVGGFQLGDTESVDRVLADYEEAAHATDALIATFDDLARALPIPEDMRSYFTTDAWSPRWILLQLIAETSRHAGHADIIRESIDGATARSLLAAAEGRPDPA